MGFVNVSASEKTEKHITEEEVAGNDPYLISTEGGTIKENQKEEEMDGKIIEGEATKLDPEDQNHETNRKDDTTENYTIKEEVRLQHTSSILSPLYHPFSPSLSFSPSSCL